MATSNAVPFHPILRIFPGASPDAPDTWDQGEDISAYVRYPGNGGGQPITYSSGRPDEAATVDPGKMSLTLDNSDGRFSTHNPLGPYYGQLSRNTPAVLSMVSGEDDFGRTEATGWGTSSGGGVWTLSGSASNWSVGSGVGSRIHPTAGVIATARLGGANAADVRGRFTASTPATTTGASLIAGVILRYVSDSEFYFLTLEFNTAGTVSTKIWKRGDVELAALHPVPSLTYTPGERFTCWFQADGAELRVKVGREADPEPADWQATTSDTSVQGTGVGLTYYRLAGNTNVNARMDFDDLVIEAVEFSGAVVKWPVRWDKSGNNCWAPIEMAGLLRRLRQGTGNLDSPLRRQLPGYSPTGYWPLEDGPRATVLGSAVSGVPPAYMSVTPVVTPAGDTSLPGGGNAPTFSAASSSIRGSTPRRNGGTGFSFMFFAKLSSLPAAKTRVVTIGGSGRIATWNIYIDETAVITVEGIENDGTVTVNTSNAMGSVNPLLWTAYQLETETVAGTLDWAHIFHQVGATDFFAQTGSFATTAVARVWSWQLGGGASDLAGAAFAHVWVGPNTLPFVTESFNLVSNAYDGELASNRIARLASEEGILCTVEPGDSASVGPQRVGTLLDNLQAAADADMGILYERGSGLGFRPLSARYSRDVLMDLSVAAGQIADPPEPILDDQRVRNDVTISRDGGSSARATDDDHIAAEGRYVDSATLNVGHDDVLADHASWRVYLGTRDTLRWPGLVLDFARNPDLLASWRSRPFEPRIQVTTGLSQVVGSDPDVFAEGYAATLWPHGWRVTLDCSDARPWDVPLIDDVELIIDTDCTLNEALDLTETGVDIVLDDGAVAWGTADLPYTVACEGEEMSVTAVSGAGPTQTLTVVRATNGVAKTHSAGAALSLANPVYFGL